MAQVKIKLKEQGDAYVWKCTRKGQERAVEDPFQLILRLCSSKSLLIINQMTQEVI